MNSIWKTVFVDFQEMDALNLTKKKTLFIGLLYMWIHFMILIFFISTNPTHKTILCIAWAVNMFNIYLLCRKKGFLLAARLLAIAWVLNVTNTAWNTGGIYSTSMLWQVLIIFILAAYLDRKAALWVTFYIIATYIVFFYIQYTGIRNFKLEVLKNPPYFELISVTSLYIVILCSLFFIFTEENFNRSWKKEKEVKIDTLQIELDKKMQEIGVLRNKIARDFHDEMGNKLASIRLLSENLAVKSEKQILENEDLMQTLFTIERTSKELFDGTKDFIWSVGTKSDNVHDFFDYIREFSEKFLNDLDINLHAINHIDKNHIQKIDPTITRQLIFVLKEIITNAAKHAATNTVELSFSIDNSHLIIKVVDYGKGFDISKTQTRGLKNIAFRMNRIQSEYKCVSNSSGTTYILSILLE
ncbi:MAG: hypothetical protein EAZ53_10730 [Bacteroidetes bacterium]|nr:MAG: hypothetical protein EAZ53_10730 [Bacteroidota bacterium]